MGLKKATVSKYEELPQDKKYELEMQRQRQQMQRQDTVDTTMLTPPPPATALWITLFVITLSAFIIGLTGLLTPNYMVGEIEVHPYGEVVQSILGLEEPIPKILKMADFGLFKFCFSNDFLRVVREAIALGGGDVPVNEGGMKLDFSEQCHKVIETENQPELMKERTRVGKILMFMGLSSVFVTWLFVILVLVAGRHLSKVITGISASVSVAFLVSSLLVSMTLRGMTKDYLNLEIMKSVKSSIIDLGLNIVLIESALGEKLERIQPVNMEPGFSGFLIVASAVLMMVVGLISLLKTRSHKPG